MKIKTLKDVLSSVISKDWKEVLEWLLKRKEEKGKMKWDDTAWHFLPRWGIVNHKVLELPRKHICEIDVPE